MVEKLQRFYGGENLPQFGDSFRSERTNLSRILEEYLREDTKINKIVNSSSKKSDGVIDLDSTQLFNIETLEDICRELLPEPLGRAGKDLRAEEPAPYVIDAIQSNGQYGSSDTAGVTNNWDRNDGNNYSTRSRSGSDWNQGGDSWNWGSGRGSWNKTGENRSSSSSSSGSEWRRDTGGRERDTRRSDNNAEDFGSGAFGKSTEKGKGKGGKGGKRKEASDLKPGETFRGTVRNVTEFCAFVDIGVGSAGFLHISKFNGRDIRVNMPLEVRVTDVKYSDKWRIGLELV
jgi:hypothetical protein